MISLERGLRFRAASLRSPCRSISWGHAASLFVSQCAALRSSRQGMERVSNESRPNHRLDPDRVSFTTISCALSQLASRSCATAACSWIRGTYHLNLSARTRIGRRVKRGSRARPACPQAERLILPLHPRSPPASAAHRLEIASPPTRRGQTASGSTPGTEPGPKCRRSARAGVPCRAAPPDT